MSIENTDPNLRMVVLKEEDAEEVSEHLLDHFFPLEPLTHHLKVNLETEIRPWLRSLITHQLSQGVSVGLRDQANQDLLVGVSVNEDVRHEENGLTLDTCVTEDHPRMKQIIDVIQLLYGDIHILTQLGVDRAVHICMVSVCQEYGGQGIAKRLLEHSECLAKEKGIRSLFAEATGNYSAAAFVKKGFTITKEIPYKECEYEGKKLFCDMLVHTALRLVIKHV